MLRTDWWLSEEMELGAGEMGEGHFKYLSTCLSVLKHYRTQIYIITVRIAPVIFLTIVFWWHVCWPVIKVEVFFGSAAAAAKSLQSCPTLCDPIDGSPPGSAVPEILQARILEWVAIAFSNARKWKVKVKSLSRVGLFATPWSAAYQAPPPLGFSRQEYWSGVPLPSPFFWF